MTKKKQRNFLTGRTHAQQGYHMKRQASKRSREAQERDANLVRKMGGGRKTRAASRAGCALPAVVGVVSAIVAFGLA